jgi:predicted O-methyltransferase YrrM
MRSKKPRLKFVEDGRRSVMAAQHAEMPVFMHSIELGQLVAAIHAVGPRTVLEWGSGGSTAGVLNLVPSIERYVSVEHNEAWYSRVKSLVTDPRLELHLVPPAEPEPVIPARAWGRTRRRLLLEWFSRCENEPGLMADYVALPGKLHDSYDFILVDGRARSRCIQAGYELLVSGGVIVIHDAHRPEYRAAIEALPNHLFIEPWVQGQICVSRKP